MALSPNTSYWGLRLQCMNFASTHSIHQRFLSFLFIIVFVRFIHAVECSFSLFILFESESESLSVMYNSLWPHGLYSPWNSPGQDTGVGSLSLLQGIFPTQGLNPGLLHCWQILSQMSHKGIPCGVFHCVSVSQFIIETFLSRSQFANNMNLLYVF